MFKKDANCAKFMKMVGRKLSQKRQKSHKYPLGHHQHVQCSYRFQHDGSKFTQSGHSPLDTQNTAKFGGFLIRVRSNFGVRHFECTCIIMTLCRSYMPILVVLGASVWSPGRATQKSDTDTKTTKAIFHVSWDEFKWNVVPTKIGQNCSQSLHSRLIRREIKFSFMF